MKSARIFETSKWKFRFVLPKNIGIFSSFLMAKHAEIKNLPPLYWIPSTVLILSHHHTDVIPPACTEGIPQCTEYPPQYWSYPPLYWCYPPLYWCYPRLYWTASIVLKVSPIVLKVSLHSTECPAQYWWYLPDVLNNFQCTEQLNRRYMGWW